MIVQSRFDAYRSNREARGPRVLLTAAVAALAPMVAEMHAVALVRDLVNTPAADMGPATIEKEADRIARAHGGTLTVTKGEALEQGYPMINAVGRAAATQHAPRRIEIDWGQEASTRIARGRQGDDLPSRGR